jgi:hypothetical protein
LTDAEGAAVCIHRIVPVRYSHFVQVCVAGEFEEEDVIVFPSEAPDVRRTQEVRGDHFNYVLNGL